MNIFIVTHIIQHLTQYQPLIFHKKSTSKNRVLSAHKLNQVKHQEKEVLDCS